MTNGNILKQYADTAGIPPRTLEQAREALACAKQTNADKALARIMLRFGRLTNEARDYIIREYP